MNQKNAPDGGGPAAPKVTEVKRAQIKNPFTYLNLSQEERDAVPTPKPVQQPSPTPTAPLPAAGAGAQAIQRTNPFEASPQTKTIQNTLFSLNAKNAPYYVVDQAQKTLDRQKAADTIAHMLQYDATPVAVQHVQDGPDISNPVGAGKPAGNNFGYTNGQYKAILNEFWKTHPEKAPNGSLSKNMSFPTRQEADTIAKTLSPKQYAPPPTS